MKRKPHQQRAGLRFGDVFENFANEQLALIGAVAMAYNASEAVLDKLTAHSFKFRADPHEIVSRINGSEGKAGIVRAALSVLDLPQDVMTAIPETLSGGGFLHLKKLRDAVIHARIFDATTAVALVPERQGGRSDVLLSAEALGWLYNNLVLLKPEMQELLNILDFAMRLVSLPAPDDQHKSRLEQSLRDATARYQVHQRRRLALPPAPKFPDQSATLAVPPRAELQG